MDAWLDLTKQEHSYLFGFLQGDGHLSQDRHGGAKGKLSVEVGVQDRTLLEQFSTLVPYRSTITERCRTTNFRDQYVSAVWRVNDYGFRKQLTEAGMPAGRKSAIIKPPTTEYLPADYFRGLVDADGSVGLDKRGLPYLTLLTSSDELANAFVSYIETLTGKHKAPNRNRRDDVYNIMVWKEDAQAVAGALYYPKCLCLPRKAAKASQVVAWQRPSTMKRGPERKPWTAKEDAFVLSHTLAESVSALNRSLNSVRVRRGRLKRAAKVQMVTD